MPSEEAFALAASRRGLVIAPAGCGKTYLLAEAVACSKGRQLVLTHTHAGVRAIRGHMERQGIPSAQYQINTIDGFALRYASFFPTLSGWADSIPSAADWKPLRIAAQNVVLRGAVRQVLSASYSGVFVDEYQDCSVGQHKLLLLLAEFLPVRILGDPLQAIFAILDESDSCIWKEVESHFSMIAHLSTPHRWNNTNHDLGTWLLDIRTRLIAGDEIDLRDGPLSWHSTAIDTDQSRIRACWGIKPRRGESTIALRQWRPQCHKLARSLKGQYRAMETVECEDLLNWSQKLEEAKGIERVAIMLQFADLCIARLPAAVKQFGERLLEGKSLKPQRDDYKWVVRAIEIVANSASLCSLIDLMDAILSINHPLVRARDELWREMRRALNEHRLQPGNSLRQTAWNQRNRLRHIGAKIERTALGTPLLVKGLEFDHAVVLDAADHGDAESLYVALTRASRSLTVLSTQSVLRRERPRYLLQNGGTQPIQ